MKKLSELNISQAPWRFTDDGMGEYDIRCSGVSYGEDYEGDDIIASGIQKKDAPMFAAAPKLYKGLYDAWHQICVNPNTKCKDCAFNGLRCSEWRAALAEASGEGAGDGK